MKNEAVAHPENFATLQTTPRDDLERLLMEEYLAERGCSLAALNFVPPEKAKLLLTEASQFASLQLTEIESSAHLWSEVNG
jgi:hypothetical protein